MNRMIMGALLAAAGVAVGMLVAAPSTVASDPKTAAAGKGGEAPKAGATPATPSVTAPPDKPVSPPSGTPDQTDAEKKPPPRPCQPEPCAVAPCARPTGGWDVAIAALFVIAILGAVVAVGRLARPVAEAVDELRDLRGFVRNQLAREQEANQAARAWGLQGFEALTRASRAADTSGLAVFGVQPPTGAALAQVHVFGRGFEPGLQLLVAGVAATDVTVVSPSELTAKVPAGAAGTRATVTVVWPGGRSAYLEAAFAYT